MDPTDLHLSGLESFSFDYVVKWPVSLVVNRKVKTIIIPSYFSVFVFVSVSVLFFQSDMGVGSEIKIISAQTLLQVNIGNASTATLGILLRDGIVFQAFRC